MKFQLQSKEVATEMSFDSLILPIDLMNIMPNTGLVVELLYCFSYVKQDMRKIQAGDIALHSAERLADIERLATMIMRSGADLYRLFNNSTLPAPRRAGHEAVRELQRTQSKCSSGGKRAGAGAGAGATGKTATEWPSEPSRQSFGFWLPHWPNVDEKICAEQIRACLDHSNAIEKAYCESEGIPDLARLAMGFERDSEGRIQEDTSDVVDNATE